MNNELIKVTVKNDQQLVSARDLYKGLGIKRRFSAWWEQNGKEFEEDIDFQPVLISTPTVSYTHLTLPTTERV